MKIRYLKTKEEFELEVPDPIGNDSETIFVRISDYDLFVLLNSGFANRADLDDDTFLGIRKLCENWNLSIRTLKLAKTQQHLRRLNRTDTSWIELSKKERKPRTKSDPNGDSERIEYLRENFDEIAANCIRHDWFEEYSRLRKDLDKGVPKQRIREDWRALKAKTLYL